MFKVSTVSQVFKVFKVSKVSKVSKLSQVFKVFKVSKVFSMCSSIFTNQISLTYNKTSLTDMCNSTDANAFKRTSVDFCFLCIILKLSHSFEKHKILKGHKKIHLLPACWKTTDTVLMIEMHSVTKFFLDINQLCCLNPGHNRKINTEKLNFHAEILSSLI